MGGKSLIVPLYAILSTCGGIAATGDCRMSQEPRLDKPRFPYKSITISIILKYPKIVFIVFIVFIV